MTNRKLINFFTYIVLSVSLSSCVDENETFTGYLVAKEYTPEHMSNETPKTISYAGVIIVPKPVQPPPPYKVDAKWVWFIANKDEVITKNVSEKMFHTKKCGDIVTVKRW
jgi:hypothetical protein